MKFSMITTVLLLCTALSLGLAASSCDPKGIGCDGAMASLENLKENTAALELV